MTESNDTKTINDTSIRKRITDGHKTIGVGDGLHLKRLPSGSYAWRYNYVHNGRQKTVSYGTYPSVSLAEARSRHKDTQRLRFDLEDPAAIRAEKRKKTSSGAAPKLTFAALANAWLDHRRPQWTDNHAQGVERSLELYVYPIIGKRDVTSVTTRELWNDIIVPMEAKKINETAHRVCSRLDDIYRFGKNHPNYDINHNPAAELGDSLAPVSKRQFAYIPSSRLPELIRDIDDYVGKGENVRLTMQFMSLTFMRTCELRLLKWGEVKTIEDPLTKKGIPCLDIPSERMKREKAKKQDPQYNHVVPLSKQALAVLDQLKATRLPDVDYVFLSPVHRGPVSENTILAGLKRMGYGKLMTGHGFRHVASTLLNEFAESWALQSDWIEAQLAHIDGNKTRAIYNKARWLGPRATMMQKWADYLDSLKIDNG